MRPRGVLSLALVGAIAPAWAAAPARADGDPAAAVRVDDKVGARVPLDLDFTEASGRRIRLADLFHDDRPVFLILAYVRCTSLCSLVLSSAARAVRAMDLVPGDDYRLITVSIDPSEETAAAAARRRALVDELGPIARRSRTAVDRVSGGEPWVYLVGSEKPIRRLADALGFRYAWDPRTEQYAHPAVTFVLTADGTIARTLQGVPIDPGELAAALRAAARGQVLPPRAIAEAVLSCFRFDPTSRLYRDRIRTYLRIGAGAWMVIMIGLLGSLFAWERRRATRRAGRP